jgi:hypothetical protein
MKPIFKLESGGWFAFPENHPLDLSNSSIVCPSNQCKIISDEMVFVTGDDSMILKGDFNLVDEQSNGHFVPKKQKLVEKMYIEFGCDYQDIQEDLAKNITKYICSEPQNTYPHIGRSFNDTLYPYRFTATF